MKRSMYVMRAHPGLWYRLCSRAPKQLYGSYSRQLLGGDEQDGKLANGADRPAVLLCRIRAVRQHDGRVASHGGKRVGGSDGGLFGRDLWQGSGDGVRSGNLSVDLAGCPCRWIDGGPSGEPDFSCSEKGDRVNWKASLVDHLSRG